MYKTGGLTLEKASLMIENGIGIFSLPIGLGLNFLINGKEYTIPMVIEEPSVIAAGTHHSFISFFHSFSFSKFCSQNDKRRRRIQSKCNLSNYDWTNSGDKFKFKVLELLAS